MRRFPSTWSAGGKGRGRSGGGGGGGGEGGREIKNRFKKIDHPKDTSHTTPSLPGSSFREIQVKPPQPGCAQAAAPHSDGVSVDIKAMSPPFMSKPAIIEPKWGGITPSKWITRQSKWMATIANAARAQHRFVEVSPDASA